MPHIELLFAQYANISQFPGRQIQAEDVRNADALLCRSITKIDQQLLKGSKVQFVGTATIGVDHLDIDWLKENGIGWANAAGCNADAVAQYVLSAIAYWLKTSEQVKPVNQLKIGIVGAGNVGKALARCLDILQIDYVLYDPPLARLNGSVAFAGFESVLCCDVISLHVPITFQGEDKTFHMFDQVVLNQLSSEQLLINASRGEVIDNAALYQYLNGNKKAAKVVLDVFENEPWIDLELAKLCLIATPHIAGHTLEGKSRGSYIIYRNFCQYFNLPIIINENQMLPPGNTLNIDLLTLDRIDWEGWGPLLLSVYNIHSDSLELLASTTENIGVHFDQLRKNYVDRYTLQPRRDYSGWHVSGKDHEKYLPLFEPSS